MNKPFQRIGSESNANVGRAFEQLAAEFFAGLGIPLDCNFSVPVGVGKLKKHHAFDLGNPEMNIIIECKSHRWTAGGNIPSAKLTVWNEAMYYFHTAPPGYRKILFVLRDFSAKRNETLAQYYLRNYIHLIPSDVEFWEYDETKRTANRIDT